ncbi:hypothetical protein CYMTET_49198 [Cymbomonas tetramitiformis]|uniref:Chromo domain-containing protein n=1 Tax=Cymbomonas tetramitiformis TaxID=36881 RepID=A0AAE0EUY7_9CHLO|nr:hypothetical protein CYMTET_49198 [Cymbomonas tetramitiformis]
MPINAWRLSVRDLLSSVPDNTAFGHQDHSDNIYEVDHIQAEKKVKIDGQVVEEWVIRWKGYDAHGTWEPIQNLAGLEDDIAKFRRERDDKATLRFGASSSADAPDAEFVEDEVLRPAMRGRRTAKVWSLFNEIICPVLDKPLGLRCAIENCGATLASTTNTVNARQHLAHVHKEHLAELEADEPDGRGDGPDPDSSRPVQRSLGTRYGPGGPMASVITSLR